MAEAARLDDVLDIRLHGEFLGDLDDVARVEHGLEGALSGLPLTLRIRLAEAADLPRAVKMIGGTRAPRSAPDGAGESIHRYFGYATRRCPDHAAEEGELRGIALSRTLLPERLLANGIETERATTPTTGVGHLGLVRDIGPEFVNAGQIVAVAVERASAAGEVTILLHGGELFRVRRPTEFHHAESAIVRIQPEIQTVVGAGSPQVGAGLKNSRRENGLLHRQPTRPREPRSRGAAGESRVEFEGDRHGIEAAGNEQIEGGKRGKVLRSGNPADADLQSVVEGFLHQISLVEE